MKRALYLIVGLAFFTFFSTGLFADEICVIVKTGASSFWQNVQTGAMDAQKDLKKMSPKLSVTFLGPQSDTMISEQINMVDSAIDRDVKAIVLSPSDVTALIAPVKRAKAAGIPVLIIDSALNGPASDYVAFMATNNVGAGQEVAKDMIARLAAKGITSGKLAIESWAAGQGSEIERVGGFRDYITKNSKFTFLTTNYCNSDPVVALNQVTSTLQANPDIVGFFGANEPAAVGMGRAIAQAGLGGKIVALGFDGNKVLQDFVKDGTLQSILVQSSYKMGYLGVTMAYNVAYKKAAIPAKIDTGYILVNKDNIDTPEAKNVLY
jgi:ribose transport system substrate-binding protein